MYPLSASSLDGKEVRRLADLTEVLELLEPPAKVQLDVVRGSERRTVSVDVMDIGE
jgi:S1-C subfamily serine protease